MLAKAKTHEDILNLVDAYSLTKNEVYFDRDPTTFNCVLNYYRTERLHVLDDTDDTLSIPEMVQYELASYVF